ncbi:MULTISPECIES: hypothetical protein [unclassified Curtobacterium]|uniref:hypothetical protein n=1 Tax=unclassified Curtobacterium TaxID=257496 RepID=UPI0011B5D00B|nr:MULTISPECIES: hypothetical protein [unclassified Curtobacterium]
MPSIAWSGGRAGLALVVPFTAGLLLAGVVLLLGVPGGRVALVNGAFAALDGPGYPWPCSPWARSSRRSGSVSG